MTNKKLSYSPIHLLFNPSKFSNLLNTNQSRQIPSSKNVKAVHIEQKAFKILHGPSS